MLENLGIHSIGRNKHCAGNISVTAFFPWPALASSRGHRPVIFDWRFEIVDLRLTMGDGRMGSMQGMHQPRATGRGAGATHALFIRAFSTACGFRSITVK